MSSQSVVFWPKIGKSPRYTKTCLWHVLICRVMSSCLMSCLLDSGQVLQRHTMLSMCPHYYCVCASTRIGSVKASTVTARCAWWPGYNLKCKGCNNTRKKTSTMYNNNGEKTPPVWAKHAWLSVVAHVRTGNERLVSMCGIYFTQDKQLFFWWVEVQTML